MTRAHAVEGGEGLRLAAAASLAWMDPCGCGGGGEGRGDRFVCPINHADLFTERISGLAVFACGASRSIAIAGNY